MSDTITMSRDQYEELKSKADLFEHLFEVEELTDSEMKKVEKALRSGFASKSQFLKHHPELQDV